MEKTFEEMLLDIKATGDEMMAQQENVETPAEGGEVVTGGELETTEEETPIVPSTTEGEGTGEVAEAQGAETELEGNDDPDVVSEEEELDELIELDDDEVEPSTDDTVFVEKVKEVVGEEISSPEQLKEYVENLKNEVTALKERVVENPLENIPEQLKEAVEYAKDGKADYLELLEITSIDYSQLDPATLAEQEIRQYFYDSDGNFDEDGFIDYIDNVPEKELEIRGRQRIAGLMAEQKARKDAFYAKQDAIKQRENQAIQSAVTNLNSVGSFKVKQSDKEKLITSLVNGNYKDVFLPKKNDGSIDFDKVAETLFIRDNYSKMVNVLKTQTRNSVKEDVIQSIGNQQVAGNPDVAAHNPTGVVDPLDLLMEKAKKNAESNSLAGLFGQNDNK